MCLLALAAGCGQRDYTGARRFPLSGEVTFDGKPVEWGAISFLPMSGDEQRVSGGLIENGKYSVPEPKGANEGTHRIEIHWAKLTGRKVLDQSTGEMVDERKEALPPKFHTDSELTAEVGEDKTLFDFHLTSE